MILEYKETKQNDPALQDLYTIYNEAFPKAERIPFKDLMSLPGTHLYAVYQQGDPHPAGMIDILDFKNTCQIRYLAIRPDLRNQGIGSSILTWIQSIRKDAVILVDVEADLPGHPRQALRKRRKEFYFRHGFVQGEDSYTWNKEAYDMLVWNGTCKKGEFLALWQEIVATYRLNRENRNRV